MPKRILDGEAMWRSTKIRAVEPSKFRSEFAWLLPLALANGVFEADPYRVWVDCYAFSRPEITLAIVSKILDEFERVDLLRRWEDTSGKVWAVWVGIEKPGRLPPPSSLNRKDHARGPYPPPDLLTRQPAIVASNPLGAPRESLGNHTLGFGKEGNGSGAEVAAFFFAGQVLDLTKRQHEAFLKAYPWINLESEYRKMDAWLIAKGRHRRCGSRSCVSCLKGPALFAQNWLSRTPKQATQTREFPKAQVPY